jgi:hypothetical protein
MIEYDSFFEELEDFSEFLEFIEYEVEFINGVLDEEDQILEDGTNLIYQ